ncbi:hypothetical protein PIB30_006610 [Stylosanthes scabra]|uniref:Amidase domain-containing protein n=1 Tax=Stylosanthes scabra TaxID=79078 RepID=A0ABU6Z138_9FABA|nr:hypothetical protein [Stylosanthes scabra]
MVSVSLGTESNGSIICPADRSSVVGIKPTVGLTSRASVIPISPRQDSIGPICRTVADAVHVLDVIVRFDPRDYNATKSNVISIFESHLNIFRQRGATVVDNLEIENSSIILDPFQSGETLAILAEFKSSINEYMQELVYSPLRSLAEIIEFNIKHPDQFKKNWGYLEAYALKQR